MGFPEAKNTRNPKGIEQYSIVRLVSPYDIAGTNIMTWRYFDNRQDMTFGFIPAIRRVRRMSPANRSDAFIGTDMCIDDAYGFAGKISSVEWKPTKTKVALVPFLDEKPQSLEKTERGEWMSTASIKPVIYGYEKEDWQGAPWAPTNLVWVKREVLILEMTPKDPYYNYGVQYVWVTADCWGPTYKMIHDRSDKFWKFMSVTTSGFESDDGSVKFLAWMDHMILDSRRQHATLISSMRRDVLLNFRAVLDLNDFSLAGFQKYCK